MENVILISSQIYRDKKEHTMRAGALILVLTSFLLLSGCASFPKKVAEGDCLILVKADVVDPERAPVHRDYYFNLDGGYKQVLVFQRSGYASILIHEPGVSIATISTNVSGQTQGTYGKYPVDIKLPYEAGKVVILDTVFTQTIKSAGQNSYISSLNTRKLTSAEKSALLDQVSSLPEYATWSQ